MKSFISLLFAYFLIATNLGLSNGLNHLENFSNISLDKSEAIQPPVSDVQFYLSSNSSGLVSVFDKMEGNTLAMSSFTSVATDADGIYYDKATDVLYQLNRSENVVNAYSNVRTSLADGIEPTVTATSSSDFSNGRKIGFYNGKLVVAQDRSSTNGGDKFFIYSASGTSITLDKTYESTISLRSIFLSGNTLYAVQDNSNKIATYNNFFDKSAGKVFPSSLVDIEGAQLIRGINYVSESDMMLLTDIGDPSNASDGAIIRIRKYAIAGADKTVSAGEQIRVSGGSSLLGNPMDIAYDKADQRVYVAEGLRNDGMMLCFKLPVLTGGIAPEYSQMVAGASAINFPDSGFFPCQTIAGGTVSLNGGVTETTIVIDGIPDMLTFNSQGATSNTSFTYVVTDADGVILGIPPSNMVDFDPAGTGLCKVYGLSYVGDLNISLGDNFLEDGLAISSDCFDVSDNSITVNRIEAGTSQMRIFTSSNTSGQIGVFSVLEDLSLASSSFPSDAGDADGIYYDQDNDVLYQLNRTENRIDVYGEVIASLDAGILPSVIASSTSDFSNGREIAVVDNKLVVAQDENDSNGGNKLVVYDITPSSVTFDKEYTVDINLWGIFATGNALFAIEDNSGNVAVYNDFFNMPAGAITPSNLVMVEDMVRTHGLVYDFHDDILVLTDIGDAASDENDGAIVVIRNFTEVSSDGFVSASEQARAFGGASQLANPVDITLDRPGKLVYVAERKKNGGMLYAFKLPKLTGGIAPEYSTPLPGGSAVHLPGLEVSLCEIANGGEIALTSGGTETTIIVDNKADEITFVSTVPEEVVGFQFTYVITDQNGVILGLPQMNTVDFNGAGLGTCYVYGLSYVGDLNIAVDDNLFAEGIEYSTACSDLSDSRLTINRVEPQKGVAYLFASSNTENSVAAFSILSGNGLLPGFFYTAATDADGLSFDTRRNVLYQVNRTANRVDALIGVDAFFSAGATPTVITSSMADFSNGREVARIGDKLIVAQDGDDTNGGNRFYVYDASALGITLERVIETDINLWGIVADGNNLYAIEDNSNNVAIYRNILQNKDDFISPSSKVSVEGITRTHGIDFDSRRKRMFLTDIGSAGNDADGAIVYISRWRTASQNDTISLDEQIRVEGDSTLLGNPVDIKYDGQGERIYVAERANNGGRILGFDLSEILDGEFDPSFIHNFLGASSVEVSDPLRRNTQIVSTDRSVPSSNHKLYPSPASEKINIDLKSLDDVNAQVQIFDMTGKLVMSENITVVKGENTITLEVRNLSSGFHIVNIPGLNYSEKFLKIK
jgi:hypothetical protein